MSYSKMRETPFKQKVEKWLEDNGYWFIKYWAGARYTKEGIPDILACINGTFYGMELKGDDGIPTLLQLKNLRDIRKADGIGVLLYPDDFKSFVELTRGMESGQSWYSQNIDKQLKLFNKLKNIY